MLSEIINRQFNYFVIRQVWAICKSRRYDKGDSLFDNIGITRGRFTRALDGIPVRLAKDELNSLCERTGIDEKFFTGKKRYDVPGISEQDIEDFCNYRSKNSNDIDLYKKLEAKIKKNLEKECSNLNNRDLQCVIQYATSLQPIASQSNKEIADQIVDQLKRTLSFKFLSGCDIETLNELGKQLKQDFDNVNTVLKYEKLKSK